MAKYVFGVDIGGTTVKIGLFTAEVSKSTIAKWALKGMFPCKAAGYVMRIERIPFLEWVDRNRKVV